MAKRVLVACGNGVATSTVVAAKIKDYCADHGVAIQVTQCKMLELHDKANDYDLV
ncbi:MAG TPA: PTS galactitol transporter subunit IIB, partial [Candidatus Olsenella pullicola]|nr:PTS galactitol transporter subunit IIB [Candidatus Olsenella pullicola]